MDGVTITRKNYWHPCVLGPEFEKLDGTADYARLLNACYWADNLTATEWPVMLEQRTDKRVKSRMKRKIAGWLMILARIAYLNPDLFKAACADARKLYGEQVREDYPWADIVPNLVGLEDADADADEYVVTVSRHPLDPDGYERRTVTVFEDAEGDWFVRRDGRLRLVRFFFPPTSVDDGEAETA
jgi:hypothetical protein